MDPNSNPLYVGIAIFASVLLVLSRSFLTAFREWADEHRRREEEQNQAEWAIYIRRIEDLETQLEKERKDRKRDAAEAQAKLNALYALQVKHAEWDREVYDKCVAAGIKISIPPSII